MEKQVKIRLLASYNGHSIKQNGNIDIGLKCTYEELSNSMQTAQLLNNDIKLFAKLPGQKAMGLGVFRLKGLKIDHDGESVITFNSQINFVEIEEVNKFVTNEKFEVRLISTIEVEDEEPEDEVEE